MGKAGAYRIHVLTFYIESYSFFTKDFLNVTLLGVFSCKGSKNMEFLKKRESGISERNSSFENQRQCKNKNS